MLTVLRSGGEYGPWHVQKLQWQLEQWAPGARLVCLTDMEVSVPGVETIPLLHKWRGWWSKIELFRPDIGADFLYTDLDNVIVGPIDELFTREYTTQRLGWNALMYVPDPKLLPVYEQFRADPEYFMQLFDTPCPGRSHGDAGFVAQYVGLRSQYWEDVVPGRVVNIVEMIRPTPFGPRWGGVPPDARVVLCATPDRRPWKLPMF